MSRFFYHKMWTALKDSLWKKRLLFSSLGAIGGYAYYYYIGCTSGTCPISSNPWISTIYGAGMGLILTIGNRTEAHSGISQTPKE